MNSKWLKYALGAVVLVLLAAQAVQPDRTNPPADPSASFVAVAKPSQHMASITNRACMDCHSNETKWPWYSKVSPVSWLVAKDVKAGRAHLNLSEWRLLGEEMSKIRQTEMCEDMKKGDMPLPQYVLLHPEAKVSSAEASAACASLN
jgi:hypothetical protein